MVDTPLYSFRLFLGIFSGVIMARLNTASYARPRTHEGAPAKRINYEQQLRRSVMSCLLWEREFYEDGMDIASRINELVPKVTPLKVADMAIEARTKMKLRHAPLLIAREMARHPQHGKLVANTLQQVIQRPDEITEFLAIYWQQGKQPLSAQVKKGLAKAFPKFDEYQLAKYNRKTAIKLRDALFLCHANPKNREQDALWKRLINNELAVPDTWEVALSARDGIPKKEKWERLLRANRLGAMALLRNLRNFQQERVGESLIKKALKKVNPSNVLPFRFIAAARHAPNLERHIEKAMFRCLPEQQKLPGKTVLLVDVSGSMFCPLSANSDIRRIEAACGLAILARETCAQLEIFTFSSSVARVPDRRRGFALRDAVMQSQPFRATFLGNAVRTVGEQVRNASRIIVLTDEQSHDPVPKPKWPGYMINIASYKNGVGYGDWLHIDGWSEAVLDYVIETEKQKWS